MVPLVTSILPFVVIAQQAPELSISDIKALPGFITTVDPIYFSFNITSSSGITNGLLYVARTNATTISTGLNLTYDKVPIFPVTEFVKSEPQAWHANMQSVGVPTTLAVYVKVTNAENVTARYPPNVPLFFSVNKIPASQFSVQPLQLETVSLGRTYSYANLSITIQGEFPNPPNDYPISVDFRSIPHGFGGYNPLILTEDSGSRFWYKGTALESTELYGDPLQYPFDSYKLAFKIIIPYRNSSMPSYPIQLVPAGQFKASSDQWNRSETGQSVTYEGNSTIVTVSYNLTRLNPPYPPLLLVGIASFVLLAAANILEPGQFERRLDIYLAAIVVAVSVVVGVRLNPYGFGVTIYEEYFTFLMVAIALVVMASAISFRLKTRKRASYGDVVVGLFLFIVSELTFGPTNMPWWGWLGTVLLPSAAVAKISAEAYGSVIVQSFTGGLDRIRRRIRKISVLGVPSLARISRV
jgi:hypothetical protein